MIKAVVFDYGGVIELKDGDLIQEIADSLKITKEDWRKTKSWRPGWEYELK